MRSPNRKNLSHKHWLIMASVVFTAALGACGSGESDNRQKVADQPVRADRKQTINDSATADGSSSRSRPIKPRWEKLKVNRRPAARVNHAITSVDNSAYLFGGQADGKSLADLWQLNLKKRQWSRIKTKGPAPKARFGHNLIAEPKGTLILFGGQSDTDFFNDLWRFNPAESSWQKLSDGSGPRQRYGAAAAVDQQSGAFYVSHGFTSDGRFDDTWTFRQSRFSKSSGKGTRPLKRCLVQGTFRGGYLYIFGGQSNPKPFLGDLWKLETASQTWKELKPRHLPSARNLYAATQVRGRWLIHGGESQSGVLSDLWQFDFGKERFTQLKTVGERMPSARAKHSATATDSGTVIIFGGENETGELADTWILKL